MTIFGLILFLVSVSYPPWLYQRSALATFENQKDAELLKLESEAVTAKHEKYLKALQATTQQYSALGLRIREFTSDLGKRPKLTKSEVERRDHELEDLNAKSLEKERESDQLKELAADAQNQLGKANVELRYKVERVIWETRFGQIALLLCMLGVVAGGIIARKGFNLWSLRVQVYQDAILRSQASLDHEASREAATAPH